MFDPNQATCILQVWLATCKAFGDQVALKILELDNMACDLVSILSQTSQAESDGTLSLYSLSSHHKQNLYKECC